MTVQYRLFRRRNGIFFIQNNATGKQESLKTRDKAAAARICHARNEAQHQPLINLQIARAYLVASDPAFLRRTWQFVMDEMTTHGKAATQARCLRCMKSKLFDRLRHKKLLETTPDDFFDVLKHEQASSAHYLRRLHNLALNLGWLLVPVLAPKLWPKHQPKARRGITPAEHQLILEAEKNAERNLYYQLLWEIGASQSDAANLTAGNIDWPTQCLSYFRMKTGEHADEALIVTTGKFTRDAQNFAAGKPLRLIDGPQLLTLVQSVQTNSDVTAPKALRSREREKVPAGRMRDVGDKSIGAEPVTVSQSCPSCGQPMILRTSKRGTNAGNQFWGCSTYPKCKGTRKL